MLHGQYMSRMKKDIDKVKDHYDWVIIQAGGNDLAWNSSPEEIFEKLKKVWEVPLKAGVKVMALTVTEHAHSTTPMKEKFEKFNKLVSDHHADGFYTADIAKAIPWSTMDDEKRKRIWDDGVHLKKEGYELMGDAIADRLIEIIKEKKPHGMFL